MSGVSQDRVEYVPTLEVVTGEDWDPRRVPGRNRIRPGQTEVARYTSILCTLVAQVYAEEVIVTWQRAAIWIGRDGYLIMFRPKPLPLDSRSTGKLAGNAHVVENRGPFACCRSRHPG
jgi:hypothetical protein